MTTSGTVGVISLAEYPLSTTSALQTPALQTLPGNTLPRPSGAGGNLHDDRLRQYRYWNAGPSVSNTTELLQHRQPEFERFARHARTPHPATVA